MNNSIFLDQTFKIYKANRAIGTLSAPLQEYFVSNIAQYLFTKSKNRNEDLIQRYESYEEIAEGLSLESSETVNGEYKICYLIIKHRYMGVLPRQIMICITKVGEKRKFNTIILLKQSGNTSINNLFLRLVEEINFDEPLIIKDYKLNYAYIKDVINQLSFKLTQTYRNPIDKLIGNIEVVYTQGSNSMNDNLRNIIINVPSKDIALFQETSKELKLVDLINDFLYQTSKIRFDKLSIIKFSSTLLGLSIDGKFKISSTNIALIDTIEPQIDTEDFMENPSNHLDDDIKDKDSLIWFLLSSVYNAESEL